MLADDADPGLTLLIGLEAVMRVLFQSGADLAENADGDIVVRRRYWLVHQHRGRLLHDVPEGALQVIPPESARGQKLLHDEMTREFLTRLLAL
jgi:hypothetical protein